MKTEKALEYKGLPYIGEPMTFDETTQPTLGREVHVEQFDLSSEKDMAEYNRILQKVGDGKSVVSFEEKVYDQDIKSWRILLRWFDLVYKEPKKRDIENE